MLLDVGTLLAQRFERSSSALEGQSSPIAHGIGSASNFGFPLFSASRDVLAYPAGSIERRLEWFDRAGTSLGVVGELGLGGGSRRKREERGNDEFHDVLQSNPANTMTVMSKFSDAIVSGATPS